jgi:hypothetical protein
MSDSIPISQQEFGTMPRLQVEGAREYRYKSRNRASSDGLGRDRCIAIFLDGLIARLTTASIGCQI